MYLLHFVKNSFPVTLFFILFNNYHIYSIRRWFVSSILHGGKKSFALQLSMRPWEAEVGLGAGARAVVAAYPLCLSMPSQSSPATPSLPPAPLALLLTFAQHGSLCPHCNLKHGSQSTCSSLAL